MASERSSISKQELMMLSRLFQEEKKENKIKHNYITINIDRKYLGMNKKERERGKKDEK